MVRETDEESDHNFMLCKIKLKLMRTQKRNEQLLDSSRLKGLPMVAQLPNEDEVGEQFPNPGECNDR
jgi:hypothetical protein